MSSIEAVINVGKPSTKLSYPKLMVSGISKNVYLMCSENYGTCVFVGSENAWSVGESQPLNSRDLEDFSGDVTLKNRMH